MSTYLWINLLSISIPFLASFDPRLGFYRNWKYLFPAMLLTMLLFIPWDIVFTEKGIWGFNPVYLSGISLFGLPLGEWLFFIAIPYACLFTYEALKYLVRKDYYEKYVTRINYVLMAILVILGLVFIERAYTSLTFVLTAVFIALQQFIIKGKYLGRFYFSFLIVLIPFFIVNGILTGSFIEDQVVWYSDAENLGIRMFTIPVEDSVYALLLLMMNVTFYESLKKAY
ncbi:MAG: lycopene cyclase domain-containing protein [Bacteroidales bacterium]|nr:lycopene cyclase domain-containing protein [Bacteroidales bacterium]MCF8345051.1 lycopene cyclase domain-containing protein [Bacteroidales bacterium]MCF8352647.1 lycopene cyclase domain-containing protein [Bacteroidales bacterium]MCF8375722.1 lycopene cyclase domain-containing protein [Bacteroidales bacterium]MCF8400322.1 lycopene cyclase domain-containing protein [Bacteroidales bacterium]